MIIYLSKNCYFIVFFSYFDLAYFLIFNLKIVHYCKKEREDFDKIFNKFLGGIMSNKAVKQELIYIISMSFAVIICCLFMYTLSFSQDIPETIMIEHNIHRLDRFGPVRFGHKHHIELGIICKKCHHDWDEYSYEYPVECVKCHGTDTKGDVVSLRTAYLKSCLGCHMTPGPDGKKLGPTVCTDCHLYKKF